MSTNANEHPVVNAVAFGVGVYAGNKRAEERAARKAAGQLRWYHQIFDAIVFVIGLVCLIPCLAVALLSIAIAAMVSFLVVAGIVMAIAQYT